jgi:hypothetical protein
MKGQAFTVSCAEPVRERSAFAPDIQTARLNDLDIESRPVAVGVQSYTIHKMADYKIPDDDWYYYASIRDLPLYLWQYFAEDLTGSRAGLSPHKRRLQFPLVDNDVTIDPRLVVRLYRGWWARVLFPAETHTSLRDFITKETGDWPNLTEKGIKRSLPKDYPAEIKLADFFQIVERHNPPGHLEFECLSKLLPDPFEAKLFLHRIDEKAVDRLIEYGDAPPDPQSIPAAMVFVYLQNPTAYPGLARLLDDVYLPDFEDGGEVQVFDEGRLHYRPRKPRKTER